MDKLQDWWNEASARDQLAIVILGIALAIFIMFQVVLAPFVNMAQTQQNRVEAQTEAFERVKSLAAEWKSRSADKDGDAQSDTVENLVEASFSKHGLRVSGFDASGRSGIRVRFEDVNYEKLLAWFHDLEIGQGIKMKDVSVAASAQPGRVSASIIIQKN